MTDLTITFKWTFASNFHVGSGLAEYAGIDRLIRLDANGWPYLPGDAVKGAIRGTAERLARWLDAPIQKEKPDEPHFPAHGPMQRVFQTNDHGCCYQFLPAYADTGGMQVRISSTSLEPESGVAREKTLRSIAAAHGLMFQNRIIAWGGNWGTGTSDYWDTLFLGASILATTAIGGHKSTGFGQLEIGDLQCDRIANLTQLLTEENTIGEIKRCLSAGAS